MKSRFRFAAAFAVLAFYWPILALAATTFITAGGTTSSTWSLGGTLGPLWNNNAGVLEARNPANSAYIVVRGATPAASNDLATKAYVDSASGGTLAGDVTGLASSNALVSMSGSSGTVSVSATALTATQGNAGLTIGQAQQANASAPVDLTIAPQAPGAGASGSTNGTPGDLVVAIASPVSTGTEGFLKVNRGGSQVWAIGAVPGNSGWSGLYAANGSPPSASNYVFANDGSNTSIRASGNVIFNQTSGTTLGFLGHTSADELSFGATPAAAGFLRATNNATIVAARNAANSADLNIASTTSSNVINFGDSTSSSVSISGPTLNLFSPNIVFDDASAAAVTWTNASAGASSMSIAQGVTGYTITQAQQANGATPKSLTVAPQAPGAGASTTSNGTPGSLVVNLAAPVSTGTEAFFKITRAGGAQYYWGPYPGVGAGNISTMWLAGTGVTPSSSNWVMASDGATYTDLNAPTISSPIFLVFGGAPKHTVDTNGIQIGDGTATRFGSGTGGMLGVSPAAADPSSNGTGSVVYVGHTSNALTSRGNGGAIVEVAGPGSGTAGTARGQWLDREFFVTGLTGTATTVATYTLPSNSAVIIDEECVASCTTNRGIFASLRETATFGNAAGTVTQATVGSPTSLYNHQTGSSLALAPTFTIAGAVVSIKIAGDNGNVSDLQCRIRFSQI